MERRKKRLSVIIVLCLFLVLCVSFWCHSLIYIEDDSGAPLASFNASNLYEIENEKFSIQSNGTNARATTDGINKAIEWAKSQGYQGVSLSAGTYLIQCKWGNPYNPPNDGILVPSDTVMDLSRATLKMEQNSQPAYNLIYTMKDSSNIVINGGHLIGDRDSHTFSGGTFPTHEWGCGINIVASTNVIVQNMKIEKMTGDAITIRGGSSKNSREVTVSNNTLYDCRRQGISVVGCVGGTISKNEIYNIKGTTPEYGIDIEANSRYDARNLLIEKNTISDCKGGSILLSNGSGNTVSNNTCINGNILVGGRTSDVKVINNTLKNSILRIKEGASGVYMKDNIMEGSSRVIED